MCKCTVSCILYHINANIEKKYNCSHVMVYNAASFFMSMINMDTNWGYYVRLYFRVHVILNNIDLRCSLYITMYIICFI